MEPNAAIEEKARAIALAFSMHSGEELLLGSVLNCNDLNTLVVAASLANAVSKIVLAALRALNKVGGDLELPTLERLFIFLE